MQVEIGSVQGRVGHLDRRLGLVAVAHGQVVIRLADRQLRNQVLGPLVVGLHVGQVGAGLRQVGDLAVVIGLVGPRVDLEQHVTRLDVEPFLKQHLVQVSADPRPHVDGRFRFRPAGEIRVIDDRLRDGHADLHLLHLRFTGLRLGTVAAIQDHRQQ